MSSGADDKVVGTRQVSFWRRGDGAWDPLGAWLPGVGRTFRGEPNPGLAKKNGRRWWRLAVVDGAAADRTRSVANLKTEVSWEISHFLS